MQNENKLILSEVFSDVLMKYAFMFGEECPKDELPINGNNCIHAQISFNGYKSGVIGVLTSIDLCVEMSANVLGIDIEEMDSSEEVMDTFKELTNVICGQFLTSAYGDKPVFDLSPPILFDIDETEWLDLVDDENTIGFLVEDSPAIIYAHIEGETR